MVSRWCLLPAETDPIEKRAKDREHDEGDDCRSRESSQRVIELQRISQPIGGFAAGASPSRDRRDGNAADRPAGDQAAREEYAGPRFNFRERPIRRPHAALDQPANDPTPISSMAIVRKTPISTKAHGSLWVRMPSVMSAISVALGESSRFRSWP